MKRPLLVLFPGTVCYIHDTSNYLLAVNIVGGKNKISHGLAAAGFIVMMKNLDV